jgi:hypothetical protein
VSRPASRRQHKKFCEVEGWEQVQDAQGRPIGHHMTYELELPDGRVLRTRISRPANSESYGPALWSHILGTQLDVSEEEFWDCVEHGVKPPRPGQPPEVPADALPADLVFQLLTKLKLGEGQVAGLTRQEALDLMAEYWAKPPSG